MKTTLLTNLLFSMALPIFAIPIIRRQDLQPFTGALGGATATSVLNSGDATRPFSVKGDTFVNIGAALQRSCDQQFNACADLANNPSSGVTFSVSDCQTQLDQCTSTDQGVTASSAAAASTASTTAAAAPAASACTPA
ncbi:hypothetical protein AOQ84DRAFT_389469 [Glonium stellatum]|uniref:Uncharacterized protein n=1 Tax=Glonium stellatum TaxID=574774 RepID=A0A8E2JS90_9PEZI|nr:hypothetical protein AOQ84DRAFT_389469 [Glonium stellatum]